MAHASDICDDHCVKITATEVVSPALPMQEHWLPQSNLDLLLPPVNVGVFFCYKKPSSKQSFASVVASLKNSLSEVLVSYYAFAGRLVTNSNGEPELLCNNEGVEFSEAYADIRLAQVDFHNPDATVEGKIVPPRSPFPDKNNDRVAVFCVQVTKLKCGAVVVGCTFDHRVADAHSANMFMVSWAEVCRNQSISSIPTFRRSLLNPRRTPRYTSAIDDMYVTLSSLVADSHNIDPSPPLASRIYYLYAKDIDNLQSVAIQNCPKKYSKLEAFCAYLWRLINISGNNDEDQEESGNKLCRMGVVVDGRSRFAKLQVPATYFGNVLSIPYAEASVGEVTKKSLSWRADLIHRAIADAANEEHFRSLVDWVEKQRPDGALAKIYCKADSPSVVVSSGLRFPISKMDFGWGKSAFASYHFPWGGEAGYVMPMPNPLGDGVWVVYMHLSLCQLNAIESPPHHSTIPWLPTL